MFRFNLSSKKLAAVKADSFRRDAQIKVMQALRSNVSLDDIQIFIAKIITAKLVSDDFTVNESFEFYTRHRSVIDGLVTDITAEPFACYCDPSYLLRKLGINAPVTAEAEVKESQQKEAAARVIGENTLYDVSPETHLFPVGLKVPTAEEITAVREKRSKEKSAAPVTVQGDSERNTALKDKP